MWKIAVGFIAFALVALFVIMKGGDKVDMQGEAGHGSAEHASAPAASAPAVSAPVASTTAVSASAAPSASK
jgi:hypothetical protein